MRLHVFPPSPRAIKVLAVCNYLEIECEVQVMDYFRKDQRKPAFARINPNRRMPVLEDDDFVLWESNAILLYLASKKPEAGLWPASAREQADVLRWLSWESAHWARAIGILLDERVKKGLGLQAGERDERRIAQGVAEFAELASILDAHLKGRSWLLDKKLTIADFSIACWLTTARHGGYEVDAYPEIAGWFGAIQRLPGWQAAARGSPPSASPPWPTSLEQEPSLPSATS